MSWHFLVVCCQIDTPPLLFGVRQARFGGGVVVTLVVLEVFRKEG
jgi:hypothetical protein